MKQLHQIDVTPTEASEFFRRVEDSANLTHPLRSFERRTSPQPPMERIILQPNDQAGPIPIPPVETGYRCMARECTYLSSRRSRVKQHAKSEHGKELGIEVVQIQVGCAGHPVWVTTVDGDAKSDAEDPMHQDGEDEPDAAELVPFGLSLEHAFGDFYRAVGWWTESDTGPLSMASSWRLVHGPPQASDSIERNLLAAVKLFVERYQDFGDRFVRWPYRRLLVMIPGNAETAVVGIGGPDISADDSNVRRGAYTKHTQGTRRSYAEVGFRLCLFVYRAQRIYPQWFPKQKFFSHDMEDDDAVMSAEELLHQVQDLFWFCAREQVANWAITEPLVISFLHAWSVTLRPEFLRRADAILPTTIRTATHLTLAKPATVQKAAAALSSLMRLAYIYNALPSHVHSPEFIQLAAREQALSMRRESTLPTNPHAALNPGAPLPGGFLAFTELKRLSSVAKKEKTQQIQVMRLPQEELSFQVGDRTVAFAEILAAVSRLEQRWCRELENIILLVNQDELPGIVDQPSVHPTECLMGFAKGLPAHHGSLSDNWKAESGNAPTIVWKDADASLSADALAVFLFGEVKSATKRWKRDGKRGKSPAEQFIGHYLSLRNTVMTLAFLLMGGPPRMPEFARLVAESDGHQHRGVFVFLEAAFLIMWSEKSAYLSGQSAKTTRVLDSDTSRKVVFFNRVLSRVTHALVHRYRAKAPVSELESDASVRFCGSRRCAFNSLMWVAVGRTGSFGREDWPDGCAGAVLGPTRVNNILTGSFIRAGLQLSVSEHRKLQAQIACDDPAFATWQSGVQLSELTAKLWSHSYQTHLSRYLTHMGFSFEAEKESVEFKQAVLGSVYWHRLLSRTSSQLVSFASGSPGSRLILRTDALDETRRPDVLTRKLLKQTLRRAFCVPVSRDIYHWTYLFFS